MDFPCSVGIGDPVSIKLYGGENDGVEVKGYVRAVTFTASKVRFAVIVIAGPPPGCPTPEELQACVTGEDPPPFDPEACFTLHNVDSCLVHPRPGNPIRLPFDNYS